MIKVFSSFYLFYLVPMVQDSRSFELAGAVCAQIFINIRLGGNSLKYDFQQHRLTRKLKPFYSIKKTLSN